MLAVLVLKTQLYYTFSRFTLSVSRSRFLACSMWSFLLTEDFPEKLEDWVSSPVLNCIRKPVLKGVRIKNKSPKKSKPPYQRKSNQNNNAIQNHMTTVSKDIKSRNNAKQN